ncbi:MAG: hypothetical protein A2X86_07945 [Bdellovibrionales bacterium GWA2_49_15]|nr:MAG: hypothetical protein A2X86_07945 [Bdellovibrionales bacterium GWA2_49_15]HAZ11790.1 hypothetical protein [Bdellovibrionales bacterium]
MDNTDLSKFSFLLYEKKNPPRYFEVQKSTLRLLFFILPLLFALLSGLTYYSLRKYFKIRHQEHQIVPSVVDQFNAERSSLQSEIKDLHSLNQDLQAKLSSPQMMPPSAEGALTSNVFDIFTQIHGMKDLSSTNIFTIEDPEVIFIKDQLHFRFNIVNQTKENQKYSGHVFVIFKDENAYHIYPAEAMTAENFKIQFNQGESFATTRFRPVEATFKGAPQGEQGIFNVFIFSRTGDLVHKQTFIKKLRP